MICTKILPQPVFKDFMRFHTAITRSFRVDAEFFVMLFNKPISLSSISFAENAAAFFGLYLISHFCYNFTLSQHYPKKSKEKKAGMPILSAFPPTKITTYA